MTTQDYAAFLMTTQDYAAFLASKALTAPLRGLTKLPTLASHLYPFQRDAVAFGLRAGSWACFLDTGLGKTAVELEWCRHAAAASNGRALILTPLAVARQIEAEGARWGYPVRVIREQVDAANGINVCNYDRLERLDVPSFGAVALDESSILKNATGATARALIASVAHTRWRMAATATPAPNDHMELGQHAELLGVLSGVEMLSRFFINDTMTASHAWRLKRHAVTAFWDWVASWARMASMPSDLGDDDGAFVLPPLEIRRHHATGVQAKVPGLLFAGATSATEMHAVKRQTADARAQAAVGIIMEEWCGDLSTEKTGSVGPRSTPHIASDAGSRESRAIPTRSGATCGNGSHETEITSSPIDDSTPKSAMLDGGNGMPPIPNTASDTRRPFGRDAQSESVTDDSVRSSASASRSTRHFSKRKAAGAPSAGRLSPTAGTSGSTSITAMQPAASADCSALTATSASANSVIASTCLPPQPNISELTEPWLIWVDTDYEQDAVEAALSAASIAFLSTRGSHSVEQKEAAIAAWLDGARPVLIGKPTMLGMGLNFQHCARTVFVGRSFSYEAWYQAVRRLWRFGQRRTVVCHVIVAAGEESIGRVLERKAADHDAMKGAMREAMRRATARSARRRVAYDPKHIGRLPAWLCSTPSARKPSARSADTAPSHQPTKPSAS